METRKPNDQIGNDQFGNAESTPNDPQTPSSDSNELQVSQQVRSSGEEVEGLAQEPQPSEKTGEKKEAEEKTVAPQEEVPAEEIAEPEKVAAEAKEEKLEEKETEAIQPEDESGEEVIAMDEADEPEDPEEEEEEDEEEEEEGEKKAPVDYSQFTREQLVDALKALIDGKPLQRIKNEVDSIKINFYKKLKAENERKRKEWAEAGGDIEEFEVPEDKQEPQLKELLRQYREMRTKLNRDLEEQKTKNLEVKQAIIEQIKELVNKGESVNQTFQEFRELQQQWHESGPVPQAALNDLWENYHHHVQNFYDFIKINKELRDLDLKKNLEAKTKLCEKAEELILEPSIVNAFKKLQKYHNSWREIGPVPSENKTEIWERFREATSIINGKHQEHFKKLRDEQQVNFEAKGALCEKAEELAAMVIKTNKEWNKRSKEMIELQKMWKTIGFAPKKENNRVYERFRSACDTFFNNKRDFYEESKGEQQNNLQLKIELCIQAEAIKDSTDWKGTSDELIALQKRWKEIGPIPRKQSDEVWKRFRAACDTFFSRKSEHFSQVDGKYDENLKAKENLIAEIENYQEDDNLEANLEALKDFQRRWSEIGFVPIRKKDEIQKKYREALNKQFSKINVDEARKSIMRFKSKIDTVQGKPRQEMKMRNERDRLFNQLKQTESDIILWENNIGFFAKSKNAEQFINDIERKIEKAKETLKVLEEKIRLIDNMDS